MLDTTVKTPIPSPPGRGWPEGPGEGSIDQARTSKAPAAKQHPSASDTRIRIRTRDLAVAIRQLATLLHAGMPLVPALAALLEQYRRQPLDPILADVHHAVSTGHSFADACRRHPDVFSPLFTSLVRAGETGGCLELVLQRLAAMLEKRSRLANKLKVAFAYPVLMSLVAFAVVVFLMTFVVPSLAAIFTDMGHELPLPTRSLIALSTFLRNNAILLLLGLLALVFTVSILFRDDARRTTFHRILLRAPALGLFLRKIEASRLARTLGTLLSGGVNLLHALDIAHATIQNRHAAQSLASVHADVQQGQTLARAFRQTGLFEPVFLHTVTVGELSGNLSEQLLALADNYDDEIETLSKSATALLEPAILLLMAAVVGFIVLAILLPIFEINQML